MTTTRTVRDDIRNTLDYLTDSGLALFANEVKVTETRVSFHSHRPASAFLLSHDHPTLAQYLAWTAAGAYSAVLLDGSLVQIGYNIEGGKITGHRLAYIPCPYDVDPCLLATGEPIADILSLYRDTDAALRSPLRFDFDSRAAMPGHPAVHLTINGPHCRIACVAPIHVLRFTDFVFRHFYPALWAAHRHFFTPASWRHLGESALHDDDRRVPQLMWDLHATATN